MAPLPSSCAPSALLSTFALASAGSWQHESGRLRGGRANRRLLPSEPGSSLPSGSLPRERLCLLLKGGRVDRGLSGSGDSVCWRRLFPEASAHVWTRTDSAVGLEDLPTCSVLPLGFLHLDKTKQKKMLFMDGPTLLGSHATSTDNNHLIMTGTVGADYFSSSWHTHWVTAMLDSPEPLSYFTVCAC